MDFDEISIDHIDQFEADREMTEKLESMTSFSEAMEILGGGMEAKKEAIDKLNSMRSSYIDNLEGHELAEIVLECETWDGSLEDYRMDRNINEALLVGFENDLMKLALAIHHGDYSPYHEYVKMDEHGHLVSMSEYDYYKELKDNRERIYSRYEELLSEQPMIISNEFTWI